MLVEILSSKYKEFRHTPTGADIPMGTLTTVNNLLGFPLADVEQDNEGAFIYETELARAPKAAEAISEGEPLYYDSSEENLTTTSTDNTLVGYATRAALLADTNVYFSFDGAAAFLKA